MIYIWLSYFMVFFHTLCVLFITLSIPVIAIGYFFQWSFIRNSFYRISHISVLMVPVIETMLGLPCPLTLWENKLRKLGGLAEYSEGCLQYWIEQWFHIYLNAQTVDIASLIIGISCIALCFLVPPKFAIKKSRFLHKQAL